MSDIGFGFVNSLHNTAGGRQWLSSSCFRLSLRLRPAGWSQASRQIHDDDDRAFVGAERRRIGMPRLAAGGSSTTDADTDRPTDRRQRTSRRPLPELPSPHRLGSSHFVSAACRRPARPRDGRPSVRAAAAVLRPKLGAVRRRRSARSKPRPRATARVAARRVVGSFCCRR